MQISAIFDTAHDRDEIVRYDVQTFFIFGPVAAGRSPREKIPSD
jgi:hypothetical protein